MADDELDIDPRLARRLAALNPEVPDDGFTASLMARLPARETARPAVIAHRAPAWPLAVAAGLALAVLALLLAGSGGSPEPALFTRLADASANAPALDGLLAELPALLESHLYTVVAAAICAVSMLAPQVLEH